jgi:hypothetical protein
MVVKVDGGGALNRDTPRPVTSYEIQDTSFLLVNKFIFNCG